MKNKSYACSRMLLLCLLIFPLSYFLSAQQVAKSFTATNGTFLGFYEFKPAGYNDNPNKKYPLIIFLHGIGERGDGTSELSYLTWQGIPNLISRGATMSFTNPNTGEKESFLVLSPQLPKYLGDWQNVYVDEMLRYAKANLQVDTNKIYLTGLSLGGGGVWHYANSSLENAKQFAAIAPICGVCYYNYGTLCTTIGSSNVAVWGFTNADDNIVAPVCTIQALDALSGCNPLKIKKTVYPNGGHDSWTKAYDTGHTIQTDRNLYEWFLANAKQGAAPSPNQFPVAKPGDAVSVTLPVNSVTLNGSASNDPDGTITNYTWSKESGPGQFNISNAGAAVTAVNNLAEGIYVFKLMVTDNRGATASATVQVTVNPAPPPANISPVANAGSAIAITLPVNSATLNGAGSNDPDGNITAYSWTKVSGPSQFNIVSPAAATTALNNLVEGVYSFRLTVTDNRGGTASATVQVTVNPAPPPANISPVANAGSAIAITLPENSTTLNGSGSNDPDGNITAYSWSKVSGPAQFNIVSPSASTTVLNNLVEGVYSFSLTVSDNRGGTASATVQVTVNPAPPPANIPPVANPGNAITITLPVNSTTLNGSGSNDPDGNITAYSWTKVSGPAQFNIVSPAASTTVLNNLVEGVYSFRLTVSDNRGGTASATVQVTVNPAPPPANIPPVANAGSSIAISLPVNTTTLNGTGSNDPDGNITAYSWSKVSGPAQFNIVSPSAASTVLNNLVEGVYSFSLTVTDNRGGTASATVQVTVNAPPPPGNLYPVANAGSAITITLPVNATTLNGAASNDPDGSITTYSWSKVSGPSQYNIVSPALATTALNNLVEGVYSFKLMVTDNKGSMASATVQVTVNPAPVPQNQPPVANAGSAMTITLPVNTVTLNGSGSNDPDGTISSYTWAKTAGPSSFAIGAPASASTTVNNLTEGVYTFTLTVKDNKGATAAANVQVTVRAAALPSNQPPVANAGGAIVITLPVSSVSLSGSGSDPDGTVTGYSWTKASGPAQFNIINSNLANTVVNNLTEGVYIFKLTVTDNSGATAAATVQVTVNAAMPPANLPPSAHAGNGVSVTLPVNTVNLNGSLSTDPDGNIATYSWTKISGPSSFNIINPAAAVTSVNNLVQGIYIFKLTITDNKGASASGNVEVTVLPKANSLPLANAGPDRNLSQAAEVILDGNSSHDPDGQIISYEWKQIAGLTGVTIVNATTSKATVQGLVAGSYMFRLTVTDNAGSTATDDVSININGTQNKRPKANAGRDTTVSLPDNSTVLNASASSDPDGTVSTYSWSQLAGPAAAGFTDKSSKITQVNQLLEGEYIFVVTVTDNKGLTASDTVNIMVINAFKVTQYFNVYPNPVKHMLHLKYIYDQTGTVQLTIYNMRGTAVKTMKVDKKGMIIDMELDVSAFNAGFYFLELKFDNGKKAIKQFLKR